MQLIDREDNRKLYVQLYEILKEKIGSGEWTIGSLIPTEEDLCKMFSVSRATVRAAVLELRQARLPEKTTRKGHFCIQKCRFPGIGDVHKL